MAENKKFDKNPALLERAAKGDKEAVEELIRYNTGLVTIGKDSDAGRDWRQEEKGTTEDEMPGWHHGLDAQVFG